MLFQVADYDLFFFADDSFLTYHHRNVREIEQKLDKNFLEYL